MKNMLLIGLSIFLIFGLEAQIIEGKRKNKYDDFLSIFASFQQEAPYLKEWIEYHKLMGADHFYLYNLGSTDNYLEILEPYIKSGDVDLIEWRSLQSARSLDEARSDAIDKASRKSRWLALIGTNDFLLPLEWGSLTEMLDNHENYGQVLIMMRNFGTSHVEKIPEDKLLIETLLYRETFVPGKINPSKPIVKPQVVKKADAHECKLIPNYRTKRYNDGLEEYPPVILHHYWARDLDFLLTTKRKQLEKEGNAAWTSEDIDRFSSIHNDAYDEIMLFFAPYVRKPLFWEEPSPLLSGS